MVSKLQTSFFTLEGGAQLRVPFPEVEYPRPLYSGLGLNEGACTSVGT